MLGCSLKFVQDLSCPQDPGLSFVRRVAGMKAPACKFRHGHSSCWMSTKLFARAIWTVVPV